MIDPKTEALDIMLANERLAVLGHRLAGCGGDILGILSVAPLLAPELEALGARIDEAIEHVGAAQQVLKTRIQMLREERA